MKGFRWRLVVPLLAVGCVAFLAQLAAGKLAASVVEDPKPVGLHVTIGEITIEGNLLAKLQLTVGNDSTNVVTVDGSRSFLVAPDDQARPLSALLDKDFRPTLLPGESTSGTVSANLAVEKGSRVKLAVVWIRGALVGSATWVLEIADEAEAPALASEVGAEPAAPADTPVPASDDGAGDALASGLVLALGVALVILLGLGVWGLVLLLL